MRLNKGYDELTFAEWSNHGFYRVQRCAVEIKREERDSLQTERANGNRERAETGWLPEAERPNLCQSPNNLNLTDYSITHKLGEAFDPYSTSDYSIKSWIESVSSANCSGGSETDSSIDTTRSENEVHDFFNSLIARNTWSSFSESELGPACPVPFLV